VLKSIMIDVEFNKLSDDDLLTHLGWLYEEIKNLEEGKKSDPVIIALQEKIFAHAEEIYTLPVKDYRKKLKGCRYIAGLRGLKFEPKLYKED
jgi:hypothetical protein